MYCIMPLIKGVLSFGDTLLGHTFWIHFFHIHIVQRDFFSFFHETVSVIGFLASKYSLAI